MMNRIEQWAESAVPVTALVWLGLLLGVSFLATPVKFLAPSLSLPVALDVGRYTFMALSRIEMIAAAVLLGCAVIGAHDKVIRTGALLAAAVVVLQLTWLLPQLDARVEVIIQGGTPPPSVLHDIYVGAEATKGLLLAIVAWRSWPTRADPSSRHRTDASEREHDAV
jgi:hypothetical protein